LDINYKKIEVAVCGSLCNAILSIPNFIKDLPSVIDLVNVERE
jgi:hypothetical protein